MNTSKKNPNRHMPENSANPASKPESAQAQAPNAAQAAAEEVHFFDKQVEPYLDQPESTPYTHLTAF